jgi:hypothetical protein
MVSPAERAGSELQAVLAFREATACLALTRSVLSPSAGREVQVVVEGLAPAAERAVSAAPAAPVVVAAAAM